MNLAEIWTGPWPYILAVLFLSILLLGVYLVIRARRRREDAPPIERHHIDLEGLEEVAPPSTGTQISVYGVPVRVAVIVLARAGREEALVDESKIAAVLDAVVPGLVEEIPRHRPAIHRWPAQLSAQGFVQAFYSAIRLPGQHGKGTPWCAVAGRVEDDQKQYMLGIVGYADRANSLGEIEVEHAGRWLDVIRLRQG